MPVEQDKSPIDESDWVRRIRSSFSTKEVLVVNDLLCPIEDRFGRLCSAAPDVMRFVYARFVRVCVVMNMSAECYGKVR